jgi:LicD family protein
MRLELLKGWSRLFRSRLFRCITDGLRVRPMRTLRHIWTINPTVPETWETFSLRINGEIFLRDFIEASDEAGLNPFLMWGTLLGFVREGGFLKHDRDIDIGILARDWPKRTALIKAMRTRGYRLEFERNYKLRFIGRDLLGHLDVDVFFPWEGKMVCFLDHEIGKHGAWFPLNAFDNFRSLMFSSTRVSIPDPPEPVLETAYGDWRTPVTKYEWFRIPNWLHIADGEAWPSLPDDHTWRSPVYGGSTEVTRSRE